jgi:membrane carboxypeptidase/penicillin-binding protein
MTLKDHVTELKASPGKWKCRSCDLSMALGSASLTMEELARAYAVFGNGGLWIEPYYIEEVRDRDGKVLEKHELGTPYQVIPPELSTIMTWMLQAVVESGTATAAQALGVPTAGKTGTTNDEKDVWFVGYTPEIITSVWVGYDQPRSLGKSATGGAVALPMWLEYMKMAVPKPETEGQTKVEDAKKASKSSKGEKSAQDFLAEMKGFPMWGEPEWVPVDEGSGRQTSGWGRKYPFLEGTLPPMVVARKQGEPVIEDLATEL